MKTKSMSKAVSLLVLVALLVGAIVPVVSAQGTAVAASSVRGLLTDTGSKHYLGLKVLDQSKPVKLVMDYRQDSSALDGGAGFYIFNEEGFARFIRGANPNESNLATGALNSSSGLKQKIAIISDPVGTFSVVAYNDSNTALDYTLTAENALIVDDSGEQVTNPAAAPREVAAVETATEEAAPVVTVAASTAVSETVTATAAATATPAPAAAVSVPVITRAETLQADLPDQYSKHYFDLSVADTNTSVDVTMHYDPQDRQLLDNGFNFYVYSSDQFQQLIRSGVGPNRAENTAAGTLTTVDGLKTFQATINTPFKGYTVIVGNDSTVPVSYTLTVKNGLLVDASGQSNTAQTMMAAGAVSGTTAAAGEVASTRATTTTTTASTDPTVAAGTVYVVKSGDTIATIARAAYGDVNLWDELCAFNKLANCDRIEVGDQITVPAKAELGTGAVAAPVATTAPAAATTAPLTATEPATTTTPVGATAPVTTTTAAPAASGAGTIIDVATNARQFEILLLALSLSNLTDGLKGAGPFTLFAPADAAFAGLPEKTLDSLLADTAQLARVLQFHVVPQKLTAADITDGMSVTTVMGQNLTFGVSGGKITVNGANINTTELPASNGTVFIIDSVLLPAQ
jgi:uncharacterized surface protein with fasciclin (FAS1) repeats/nucleoid-associated protein YgaU